MNTHLNRRDFLKILGLLPFTYIDIKSSLTGGNSTNTPNILIIVFDAFSSHNLSLYGYARRTTPNIDRLASRATIYHNHYSAGNFTTPGTASILTGTYPWTHRAFQINSKVQEEVQTRNIFSLFYDHHRITYSHNPLVNILQDQFSSDIDYYKLRETLILGGYQWLPKLFGNDEDTATVSWARAIGKNEDNLSTSLFLSKIFHFLDERRSKLTEKEFPLGLPISSLDNFVLEDAINWLISAVIGLPRPFLGYFHFLPPHAPYNTRIEYVGTFKDSEIPNKKKPRHPLAKTGRIKQQYGMDHYRRTYDEFILYVDAEFNRLFLALEKVGILDNTYLILTSDHGEMFERGILGHTTPSLHDPVVRIPLLIFEPGQRIRKDIFNKTSAVDILPTLLHITGKPIPSWIEGVVLPPYSPVESDRSIFALEAKINKPSKPLRSASTMIVKEGYKLTKYFGYRFLPKGDTIIELYDIDNDPEELNDLASSNPSLAAELAEELTSQLSRADALYQ
jgi:arylsulfatase A-like enzyme